MIKWTVKLLAAQPKVTHKTEHSDDNSVSFCNWQILIYSWERVCRGAGFWELGVVLFPEGQQQIAGAYGSVMWRWLSKVYTGCTMQIVWQQHEYPPSGSILVLLSDVSIAHFKALRVSKYNQNSEMIICKFTCFLFISVSDFLEKPPHMQRWLVWIFKVCT